MADKTIYSDYYQAEIHMDPFGFIDDSPYTIVNPTTKILSNYGAPSCVPRRVVRSRNTTSFFAAPEEISAASLSQAHVVPAADGVPGVVVATSTSSQLVPGTVITHVDDKPLVDIVQSMEKSLLARNMVRPSHATSLIVALFAECRASPDAMLTVVRPMTHDRFTYQDDGTWSVRAPSTMVTSDHMLVSPIMAHSGEKLRTDVANLPLHPNAISENLHLVTSPTASTVIVDPYLSTTVPNPCIDVTNGTIVLANDDGTVDYITERGGHRVRCNVLGRTAATVVDDAAQSVDLTSNRPPFFAHMQYVESDYIPRGKRVLYLASAWNIVADHGIARCYAFEPGKIRRLKENVFPDGKQDTTYRHFYTASLAYNIATQLCSARMRCTFPKGAHASIADVMHDIVYHTGVCFPIFRKNGKTSYLHFEPLSDATSPPDAKTRQTWEIHDITPSTVISFSSTNLVRGESVVVEEKQSVDLHVDLNLWVEDGIVYASQHVDPDVRFHDCVRYDDVFRLRRGRNLAFKTLCLPIVAEIDRSSLLYVVDEERANEYVDGIMSTFISTCERCGVKAQHILMEEDLLSGTDCPIESAFRILAECQTCWHDHTPKEDTDAVCYRLRKSIRVPEPPDIAQILLIARLYCRAHDIPESFLVTRVLCDYCREVMGDEYVECDASIPVSSFRTSHTHVAAAVAHFCASLPLDPTWCILHRFETTYGSGSVYVACDSHVSYHSSSMDDVDTALHSLVHFDAHARPRLRFPGTKAMPSDLTVSLSHPPIIIWRFMRAFFLGDAVPSEVLARWESVASHFCFPAPPSAAWRHPCRAAMAVFDNTSMGTRVGRVDDEGQGRVRLQLPNGTRPDVWELGVDSCRYRGSGGLAKQREEEITTSLSPIIPRVEIIHVPRADSSVRRPRWNRGGICAPSGWNRHTILRERRSAWNPPLPLPDDIAQDDDVYIVHRDDLQTILYECRRVDVSTRQRPDWAPLSAPLAHALMMQREVKSTRVVEYDGWCVVWNIPVMGDISGEETVPRRSTIATPTLPTLRVLTRVERLTFPLCIVGHARDSHDAICVNMADETSTTTIGKLLSDRVAPRVAIRIDDKVTMACLLGDVCGGDTAKEYAMTASPKLANVDTARRIHVSPNGKRIVVEYAKTLHVHDGDGKLMNRVSTRDERDVIVDADRSDVFWSYQSRDSSVAYKHASMVERKNASSGRYVSVNNWLIRLEGQQGIISAMHASRSKWTSVCPPDRAGMDTARVIAESTFPYHVFVLRGTNMYNVDAPDSYSAPVKLHSAAARSVDEIFLRKQSVILCTSSDITVHHYGAWDAPLMQYARTRRPHDDAKSSSEPSVWDAQSPLKEDLLSYTQTEWIRSLNDASSKLLRQSPNIDIEAARALCVAKLLTLSALAYVRRKRKRYWREVFETIRAMGIAYLDDVPIVSDTLERKRIRYACQLRKKAYFPIDDIDLEDLWAYHNIIFYDRH